MLWLKANYERNARTRVLALKQLYHVSALTTHTHTHTQLAEVCHISVTEQFTSNNSELKRPHRADAKGHLHHSNLDRQGQKKVLCLLKM